MIRANTLVNGVDKWGNTALMTAARNNHLDVVISLMNHPGMDLNVQSHSNETALHRAVIHNPPAIVSQLLSDDKMDASLTDKYNCTHPLKLAIAHEKAECVTILTQHGAPE
jgi:ankyrin repeat protein